MAKIQPISLSKLELYFNKGILAGVPYLYGGKAEDRKKNPRANGKIAADPSLLKGIDCSGAVRSAIAYATNGELIIPDGSQNQRAWCEELAREGKIKKVNYADTNRYMTDKRLFIAFIKPNTNGCGPVGHVWFICQFDKDAAADTLESYGGHGIGSRNWNARPLPQMVYSVYELPTTI